MTDLPREVEHRETVRRSLRTEVHLQFGETEAMIGLTADISTGGMFVAARSPRPVGTLLRFEILLQDQEDPLMGFGEVVWIRVRSESPKRPPGMGIRFRYLVGEGQAQLDERLARLEAEAVARAAVWQGRVPGSGEGLGEQTDPPPAEGEPGAAFDPFSDGASAGVSAAGEEEETWLPPAPEEEGEGEGVAEAPPPPAPGTRRRLVLLLALLAASVALLLAWPASPLRRLLDGPPPPPRPRAAPTAAEPSSQPSPQASPPASRPPVPEPAVPEPAVPEPVVPEPVAAQPATAGGEPAAAQAGVAAAGAPAAAGATGEEGQRVAEIPGAALPAAAVGPGPSRIESISWSPVRGETVVRVEGDGPIRAGGFDHLRLEGSPPRELVRIAGILQPFRESRIEVGTPELARIRTGHHPEEGGGRLHLVFDLAAPSVAVYSVETSAGGLVITLRRQ